MGKLEVEIIEKDKNVFRKLKVQNIVKEDIILTEEEIKQIADALYNGFMEKVDCELFKILAIAGEELQYNENRINNNYLSSLKKQIKYCKNPMEKKVLEKELNSLYKKKSRKK